MPFCILDARAHPGYTLAPVVDAGLANVAATLLYLLGYAALEDYAPSLIVARA